MRPQKKAGPEPRGPRGSPFWKGYKKVMISFTPEQAAALKREALRRAMESGKGRPDSGEIIREAFDSWLSKNVKK